MSENAYIRRQSQAAFVEKYRMIGESEAFLDTMAQTSRAAKVNRPILIVGERGTGKELVAARMHYLSPRWKQPRVAVNCAAFAPELLASELFGYEQGAFTGAARRKQGRFEMANGGTLFLDELGNAPLDLQEKILRILEYGEFERVGGTETIKVDVRVVAATNRDLPSLCRKGKFKEDLLDRLSFEVVTLPPLRYRQEDIPIMVTHFASRMALELERDAAPHFSEDVMERLLRHGWPGNIRELKNTVERAVYECEEDVVEYVELDPFDSPYRPKSEDADAKPNLATRQAPVVEEKAEVADIAFDFPIDLPTAVASYEAKMVNQAMEASKFNQRKAAEFLGLSYYQLRRLLKKVEEG